MRGAWAIGVAALFVTTLATAQAKKPPNPKPTPAQSKPSQAPIEKCTGNFEEAQMKEQRGRLVEAEELYALCAVATCPSMVRADCTAKHEEIKQRVPTGTIVIRDTAGNDVAAKISVDGKPLDDWTHAHPIDPGEHVVSYEIEGSPPATQKITAVEGEKARVFTITVKAPETKKAAPVAPPPSAPTEGPAIVGPVILGGVGLVLLGSGIILEVVALGNDSKADDYRAQAAEPATSESDRAALEKSAQSRQDSASQNKTLGIVLGASGALLIAGGLTWYFVTKPSSSTQRAKLSPLTPILAPGYAGASFDLAF